MSIPAAARTQRDPGVGVTGIRPPRDAPLHGGPGARYAAADVPAEGPR